MADLMCGISSEDIHKIGVILSQSMITRIALTRFHWASWHFPFVVVFPVRQEVGFRVPCIERSDMRLCDGMGNKCKHVGRNFIMNA